MIMATKPLDEDQTTRLDLSHLRREARTALELAIVEFAPPELIDRLAIVTGLFEALAELPADSDPAIAIGPVTADRARIALELWRSWADKHKKLA
jgi:hypothetical protein